MKRVQSYPARGITVTFDPNVCSHSGVCLRTLPAVFDVRRRRWVAAAAASPEAIAAAIRKCPSGALQYVLEGEAQPPAPAEDAPPGTTILASFNGPLLVEGTFQVLNDNGDVLSTPGRAALCRCGGTKNQPFCDGTHRTNGFQTRPAGESGRPS
jgi:uncharacterized Fe-S cluster protein YjdI/CDGSH-type Zn-finger protein